MAAKAKHFLIAKDGNSEEHNDDSAEADPDRGRFAISDGAAESGFSRIWSRLLVEHFVQRADASVDDWSWLPAAQKQWLAELDGVEIPWYGEDQFKQGAFATFLGVAIVESTERRRRWQCVAVGDSCLFHTRDGKLLHAFPLKTSDEFGRLPNLVGSRAEVDFVRRKRAVYRQGKGRAEDRLWLISDGLSKWCFAKEEAEQPPWSEMAEKVLDSDQADFAAWIAELREHRGLENDDVALMLIDL